MTKILETTASVAVVLFMAVGIVYFVDRAFDNIERVTCYKWQEYEKMYTLYETHPDTVQRCLVLGVDVHEDY